MGVCLRLCLLLRTRVLLYFFYRSFTVCFLEHVIMHSLLIPFFPPFYLSSLSCHLLLDAEV